MYQYIHITMAAYFIVQYLFIHLPTDEHLGYFNLLAICEYLASVNTHVCVFVWMYAFIFFFGGYLSWFIFLNLSPCCLFLWGPPQ